MIKWQTFDSFSNYEQSISKMEATVKKIICGEAQQQVWLLEYNPLFTAGTSSKTCDLIKKNQFPIYSAKRGGQYTYHGPGQRVIYPLLNLKHYKMDVRHYVWLLEKWIIDTIAECGIQCERQDKRVGIWTSNNGKKEKIAAIGVRVTKWISSHGVSVNINPNLSHYEGIIPCGIKDQGVTSLSKLGVNISFSEFDHLLKKHFLKNF